MRRKIIPLIMVLTIGCFNAHAQWVVTDPSVIGTLQGIAGSQTAQHIQSLAEAIKTVEFLQSQVAKTQDMLNLAKEAARGLDGVQFASEFRNVIMETTDVLSDVKDYVDTAEDVSGQWKKVFGSLDNWMDNANEMFGNIDMSDKVNSKGFLIADSYQQLYKKNSQYAQMFIDNAKNVNEKGALKQIAQEIAQLIQMENHTIFLLSQMLKAQSVENSNTNLKRKEEATQFDQENQGVRRFMSMVDDKTFEM